MFARIVFVLTALCSVTAFAAPATPLEKSAKKAAYGYLFRKAARDGATPAEMTQFRKNSQLFAKQSPTKAHLVNLALRTKEDGKWNEMAIVSTWNSRSGRIAPLKFSPNAAPALLRDARSLETVVKTAPKLSTLF